METPHNGSAGCNCGCMGFGPVISHLMDNLGPKEARDHFRSARVEFLKGMRALLDARIDQLSKKGAAAGAGTQVPVE